MNKVSIAIATYNGAKYLKEQLDSIYTQTLLPFEVIVCDDGSIDETIKILEEFKELKGLKYFINPIKLGFFRNFEKAITLCAGDLIALSDQDDYWLPNKLERLVNEIGASDLICSDAILIDANNNIIQESYFNYQNLFPYSDDLFLNIFFNNYVTGCTILFKNKLLENALPMPDIRYHDQWLGLVASKQGGVKFLNEKLIFYRQHLNNDTGSHQFISMNEKIKNLYQSISKRKILKSKISIISKEIKQILASKIGLNEYEKKLLKNSIIYYENRMRFWINPICVFYGLKYNKVYFGYYDSIFKRIFASFGTLFF